MLSDLNQEVRARRSKCVCLAGPSPPLPEKRAVTAAAAGIVSTFVSQQPLADWDEDLAAVIKHSLPRTEAAAHLRLLCPQWPEKSSQKNGWGVGVGVEVLSKRLVSKWTNKKRRTR